MFRLPPSSLFARRSLMVLAVSLVLSPTLGLAQQTNDQPTDQRKPANEEKRLTFEQQKALAHMKELEQRMFRLAKTIHEAQPEDASRLRMGVRRSRDALVTDRMKQTAKMLASMNLKGARGKQQKILNDLNDLKQLLLTADLDLQLKLEQLRKMHQAIKAIDELKKKEQDQHDKTSEVADQDKNKTKPLFKLLESGEKRNAATAEDIERQVEQLGEGAGAQAGKVGAAGKDMNSAAGKLGTQQANKAAGKQQDAINKLNNARNNIAKKRKQLQKQIEQEVRRKVMDNLKQMLADQTDVRKATQTLMPRLAEGGEDQAVAAVQRLAQTEDNITDLAQDTISLAREVGFSVTLPPTLNALKYHMAVVSDDLRTAATDEGTITREKRVEKRLEQLVDAMQASNKASKKNANPNNQPPNVNKKRKQMNKLLAEVRMLKIMQLAVNSATKDVEHMRGQGVSTSQLNRRYQKVQHQQQAVEKTTRKLDKFAKEKRAQR